MATLGEDLRDTLHVHGILGHILGCEADAEEITVVRTMLDSQGRPALRHPDDTDGELDVVRVYETFDLRVDRMAR